MSLNGWYYIKTWDEMFREYGGTDKYVQVPCLFTKKMEETIPRNRLVYVVDGKTQMHGFDDWAIGEEMIKSKCDPKKHYVWENGFVKIKSWREMLSEFGYGKNDSSYIKVPKVFTDSMEKLMPESRIIEINAGVWEPKDSVLSYVISVEMVSEWYGPQENPRKTSLITPKEPVEIKLEKPSYINVTSSSLLEKFVDPRTKSGMYTDDILNLVVRSNTAEVTYRGSHLASIDFPKNKIYLTWLSIGCARDFFKRFIKILNTDRIKVLDYGIYAKNKHNKYEIIACGDYVEMGAVDYDFSV